MLWRNKFFDVCDLQIPQSSTHIFLEIWCFEVLCQLPLLPEDHSVVITNRGKLLVASTLSAFSAILTFTVLRRSHRPADHFIKIHRSILLTLYFHAHAVLATSSALKDGHVGREEGTGYRHCHKVFYPDLSWQTDKACGSHGTSGLVSRLTFQAPEASLLRWVFELGLFPSAVCPCRHLQQPAYKFVNCLINPLGQQFFSFNDGILSEQTVVEQICL